MLTEAEIYGVLEQALEDTQRHSSVQHPFSPSLTITGKESVFDSLDTMIFLNNVDDILTEKLGRTVTVINDDVFAMEDSPFRTLQTLAGYIGEMVQAMDV